MSTDPEINRLNHENRKLRTRLSQVMERVRDNEATFRRLQDLEQEMLNCAELAPLLERLLVTNPRTLDLTATGLVLAPPAVEVRSLMNAGSCPAGVDIALPTELPPEAFEGITLGPTESHHRALFPAGKVPESLALLPLRRGDDFLGLYALGGRKGRFTADQGTDFLARLSAVGATCLDNAISHTRLAQMALSDPLTGLDNRRAFDRRLTEWVAHARRRNTDLTCLFLDLDHFKPVNDTYGHAFGDRVLMAVAEALANTCRTGDVIARIGGEEFAVLLDETEPEAIATAAERIRAAITGAGAALAEQPLELTASIGVARLCPGETGAELVERADAALYEAKEGGRDRVVFHGDGI